MSRSRAASLNPPQLRITDRAVMDEKGANQSWL
jgi:hypothetical protein